MLKPWFQNNIVDPDTYLQSGF